MNQKTNLQKLLNAMIEKGFNESMVPVVTSLVQKMIESGEISAEEGVQYIEAYSLSGMQQNIEKESRPVSKEEDSFEEQIETPKSNIADLFSNDIATPQNENVEKTHLSENSNIFENEQVGFGGGRNDFNEKDQMAMPIFQGDFESNQNDTREETIAPPIPQNEPDDVEVEQPPLSENVKEEKTYSIDDVDVDVDYDIFTIQKKEEQEPVQDEEIRQDKILTLEESGESEHIVEIEPEEDVIVEEKQLQLKSSLYETSYDKKTEIQPEKRIFKKPEAINKDKKPNDLFGFLKSEDPTAYSQMKQIEKYARIDPLKAGNGIREALEYLLKNLREQYGITDEDIRNENPNERFPETNSNNIIRALSIQKKLPFFKWDNHGIYLTEGGKKKRIIERRNIPPLCSMLHYLRLLGNNASHSGNNTNWPTLNFDNIVLALNVFRRIYSEQTGKKDSYLNEKFISIGDYQIIQNYVPHDSVQSKCIMEYIARKSNEEYAIIRQYKKREVDEAFIKRNITTYNAVLDINTKDIPEMGQIEEITTNEGEDYFLAYKFRRYPEILSNDILSRFAKESAIDPYYNRLILCKDIALCIEKLHGLKEPIYHRMLTYEAIAVCDYTDREIGLVPSVIKFDFSKIESAQVAATVVEHWQEAVRVTEKAEQKMISKYFPVNKAVETSWDKIDIYAMGVLFGDILRGKIGETICTTKELERTGKYPESIVDIYKKATSVDPDIRPDAATIRKTMEEEISLWK